MEKELVRIFFQEAQIKGFNIDQVPDFIEVRMRKKISMSFVYYLRDQQYREDGYWYYQLARDSIAYVGAYRRAISEIDRYKKELWLILMDPRTERKLKIECTKELHNLTKTGVLLLRDLPFITNLSRYYDPSKLDPTGQDKRPFQQVALPPNEHRTIEPPIGDMHNMGRAVFDDTNTSIVNTILDKTKNNKIIFNNQENDTGRIGNNNEEEEEEEEKEDSAIVDNRIMESMTSQLSLLGYETDSVKKAKQQQEEKEAQNRFSEAQVKALEKDLEEAVGDNEKLRAVKERYESSLSYLDSIVTEEQRQNISRLRELTDNRDLV